MKIEEINIPKIEIEPFSHVNDYQTKNYLQYTSIIKNKDYGRSVVKALSEDNRVIAIKDKLISRGSGASKYSIETLAMWFLWCAKKCGLENARAKLEQFLNSEELPVISTLWLLGLEIDDSIQLNDDYTLVPIGDMPEAWDKDFFQQRGTGHILQRLPAPKCAITKKCSVIKVWGNNSSKEISSVDNYNKTIRNLHDIAILLNVINGVSCLPFYETSYVDQDLPFGPFGLGGGCSRFYDVSAHGMTKLPASEANKLKDLTEKFKKLDEKEKPRIQRILNRLSQAKRRTQIEDIVLDLGIALEMLLLKDNQNNDQLSLSFRLRGSWLLGNSKENRMKIYNQLKQIYKYRSQVAHSGILCNGDSKKINAVRESIPDYLTIAEIICQKIIKDGSPDWDKLVLDAI